MLEKESIDKISKREKLPFAVFTSINTYTTNQHNEEIEIGYMQIFTNIIEERIQNKLRRKNS